MGIVTQLLYNAIGMVASFMVLKTAIYAVTFYLGVWQGLAADQVKDADMGRFRAGCLILTTAVLMLPFYGGIGENIVAIVRSW